MLEDIKGIGPKTILALNKLNIYNINDLITYYPYRYINYNPIQIKDAKENETVVINGYIETEPKILFIKRTLNRLSFKLNTNHEIINVAIFNRGYLKPNLKINHIVTAIGKYNPASNTLTASDLKIRPILKETIVPVYHLNADIKRSNFKRILDNALTQNFYLSNDIPDYLMQKYSLLDKMSSVKEIHNPTSLSTVKKAKITLIYEELFDFMLKINYLKINNKELSNAIAKHFDEEKLQKFILKIPFTLTNDQVNAIEDIKKDFNLEKRMNRLLLGDVGSGKTIVAFIALYMNYLSGYQGILMAPTEILAEQHFNNIKNIFQSTNINIELLTSSIKKNDRVKIINKINKNQVDILIGTHSVLNDDIKFNKLGLVITDEQHRFGVNQRKCLQEKGKEVDVLYMSATPIPRTLALTLYGDMDISEIKTKPSNRKPITTKIMKTSEIKDALSMMLEEIKQNHQIYVVAPLIDDENDSDMENVNALYEKINMAFNRKVPIGLLHGKLTGKSKDNIMNKFKNGKIKILISTTVIEVGVDVKNATMMVIFNAERFGLATLHQLRGRIGRNDLDSKCLLISDYETERLKVLEESNDGFFISQKDFELRGTGDLFGVKQSGDMTFKIANLKTDYKILLRCKDDSLDFLSNHLNNIEKYPNQKRIIDEITFID